MSPDTAPDSHRTRHGAHRHHKQTQNDMKLNHEPLDHAILVLTQMDIDLHRICIQANDAEGALIGDCAEQRISILNKLRHIKEQWTAQEPTEQPRRMTTPEIIHNALSPEPIGDPEIAPKSQSKRIPSALERYRKNKRRAEIIAWIVSAAIASGLIALAYSLKGAGL